MPSNATAFRSFFVGGFEGADHVNGDGVALDLNALTGHAFQLRGDYRRAACARHPRDQGIGGLAIDRVDLAP
jgi:hypothetical protein